MSIDTLENFIPALPMDRMSKDADALEKNDNWEELLSTLQAELLEAGVEERVTVGLSALMYSAFINRIPLLLAGPNGIEIAKAFSIALFGCAPAVLVGSPKALLQDGIFFFKSWWVGAKCTRCKNRHPFGMPVFAPVLHPGRRPRRGLHSRRIY